MDNNQMDDADKAALRTLNIRIVEELEGLNGLTRLKAPKTYPVESGIRREKAKLFYSLDRKGRVVTEKEVS